MRPTQQVDRRHLAEQGFIVPEGAVTALLEEFRIVKRAVLELPRKSASSGQRVLVCSPPGEGKTFCAANLALAHRGREEQRSACWSTPTSPSRRCLACSASTGGKGLMDALADPDPRSRTA